MMARRAPVELARAAGASRFAFVGLAPCPCTSAAAANVMEALGMAHAAAMHRKAGASWTADDWRAHIAEEEATLFPALRRVGGAGVEADVARLESDHEAYILRLDNGFSLDDPNVKDICLPIADHAALEDGLVDRYNDALLALARDRVAVRAGALLDYSGATLAHAATVPRPAMDDREHTTPRPADLGRLALLGSIGAGAAFAASYFGLGWIPLLAIGAGSSVAASYVIPPKELGEGGDNFPTWDGPGLDTAATLDGLASEQYAAEKRAADAKSEDEANRARIKKYGKLVPYVGEYVSAAVEFAGWMNSAANALGFSGFRDEFDPKDCEKCEFTEHAAKEIDRWLVHGWVPTNPTLILTPKNGVRSYADTLEAMVNRAEYLSIVRFGTDVQWTGDAYTTSSPPADGGSSTAALRAYGALTSKYIGDSRVAPLVKALANGIGTIPVWIEPAEAWYVTEKQTHPADLIGTLVAIERGRDIEASKAKARRLWVEWVSIPHGGFDVGPYRSLSRVADVFMNTWRTTSS